MGDATGGEAAPASSAPRRALREIVGLYWESGVGDDVNFFSAASGWVCCAYNSGGLLV